MNSSQLQTAEIHFKGKTPYDLEGFLQHPAHGNLHSLRIFIRYMVYLEVTVTGKLIALHRMKTLLEQNIERGNAKELIEFVTKENEHWEYANSNPNEPFQMIEAKSESKEELNLVETPILPFRPLRWAGTKDQLGACFYNLHKNKLLDCSKTELKYWIIQVFHSNDGKPLKESTIGTYIREDKRRDELPTHRHLEANTLISNESD
jgi:hypothetical protein